MISRVIRVSGLGLHSYAPQLKLSLKLQVEDANTGTSFTPPPGTSRTGVSKNMAYGAQAHVEFDLHKVWTVIFIHKPTHSRLCRCSPHVFSGL